MPAHASLLDAAPSPPVPVRARARRSVARHGLVGLIVLATAAAGVNPAAAAVPPVTIGAVGDVDVLARSSGTTLPRHAYAHFDQKVPEGKMISVKAGNNWPTTAAAAPGSPLYNHIVRWAQTIKARPGRTMFAFNHEPEASGNTSRGTSQDFIRAWRRVVDIFRQQGVTNVDYTLQMTAWAFRTPTSDRRHISKWYPGDAYVDIVGADAYNWSTCGHGNDRWMELQTLTDPVIAYARSRGKKAALPEFASVSDSRRAQWVRNAQSYLTANRTHLVAAFYFQQDPTNSANTDCVWKLRTSAEFSAYGDLARALR